MSCRRTSGIFLYPLFLFLLAAPGAYAACSHTKVVDPRDPSVGTEDTNGPVPVIDSDDMIGISADGNRNDPDDIAASPLALSILARQGWQDKLVHFSYNNTPMTSANDKDVAHHNVIQNAFDNFGYDSSTSKLFNCQSNGQWVAARDHAIDTILSTTASKRFYWIQAGPHEFAYQVLSRVAEIAPAKLANVTLVSHSNVNNGSSHPVRSGIKDGSDCGRKLEDCLDLSDDLGYFFTSLQGKAENFGSKSKTPSNWPTVAWMKTSDCAGWNAVHEAFELFADIEGGNPGLDASDGGMTYTIVTGDPDGNFAKLTSWVGDWCYGDDTGPVDVLEAVLELSTTEITVGESVTFDASGSQSSDGESLTWLRFYYDWDNDSYHQVNINTTDSYTHTYTTPGTYQVRLRVWETGPSSTISAIQTIVVTEGGDPSELEAVLELSTTTVTVGEAVTFSGDQSTPSDGEDITWYRFYYDWENDLRRTQAAPNNSYTHVYDTPGTYQVRLRVYDSSPGNTYSAIQTIVVTSGDGGGGEAVLVNDAYLNKNKASNNFDGGNIRVSRNGIWVSYLEFDISEFSGSGDALLSLYCTNSGNGEIEVFYNDTDSWNEATMTYASRITHDAGDKIGDIAGPYTAGSFVDIPLSDLPLGSESITIILEQSVSSDSTQFDSKETADSADQIPALDILPTGGG